MMDFSGTGVEELLCDESFQRYCRGENEEDIALWNEWSRGHPGRPALLEEVKRMFDTLSCRQGNRAQQLQALKDGIRQLGRFREQMMQPAVLPMEKEVPVVRLKRARVLQYAASIIVLVSLGMLTYYLNEGAGTTEAQLRRYEHYTGQDRHKTIMLPDSTIVMLNENSHLSISRNFDAEHREVAITGEAYFDVKHDPEHPFIVATSQYKIRVLGTAFNVRSYPGDSTAETTLIRGKVEIISNEPAAVPGNEIILKPGEKFTLAGMTGSPAAAQLRNGKVTQPGAGLQPHEMKEVTWSKQKLELQGETFATIAKKLESWYGLTIVFADDTVKQYRYTAMFYDETILDVLKYLQTSYPFSIQFQEDTIVIAHR